MARASTSALAAWLALFAALALCVSASSDASLHPSRHLTVETIKALAQEHLVAHGALYHAPVIGKVFPVEGAANKTYRPVVVMHGLGDSGTNPGMQSLCQSIRDKYPGIYVVCAAVADGLDSFFQGMQDQVDEFTKLVQADPKLAGGFNVVGLSQGGLIIRAYTNTVNNPPVHNLVSICGVQNGVFNCPLEAQIIPFVCEIFETNPYHFFDFLGIRLSFEDYFRDSKNRTNYLHNNPYLPKVNNELPVKNQDYISRMESLNKLVLIEALKDTVVYPYQSEQFGGYQWGTEKTVFNFTESYTYQGNWLGLKTLNEGGKVDLKSFDGDHIRFSQQFWETEVLPYFDN